MSETGDDPVEQTEQEAIDWLTRLRAGDPNDQQAFEDWYATDRLHAEAYDRVLRSWQVMGRITVTGSPADEQPAPAAPVQAAEAPGRPRRGILAVAAAAAAALLLGVLGMGLAGLGPDLPGRSAAVAYRTEIGKIRTIRLADGSRMTLDTDSAVEATIGRNHRLVRVLRGRARFDVAPDHRLPFLVETGAGTVRASDASVDVAAEQSRMTVALWRGTVDVADASGATLAAEPVAGQAVELTPSAGGTVDRPKRATDPHWVSGMLSFEDAPLGAVVAAANRYGRAPIRLGDPTLGVERFTGSFRATDPDALTHLLVAMYHLNLAIDPSGDRLLLRSPGIAHSRSK